MTKRPQRPRRRSDIFESMLFLSCALVVLGLSDEPRTFEVSFVEQNDASGSEHEGPGEPRSPDRCPRFEGTENVDGLYYAGIRRAQDEYYETVAEQLRFVETCRIDSARSARNSNSTLAMECGLGELEWLAPCIYPWEIEFSRRWERARSTYLGSFKPGQLMVYTSRPVGASFEDSKLAQERLLNRERASFRSARLLVDGNVVDMDRYYLGIHIGEPEHDSIDNTKATFILVELILRLHFPIGVHHAVVLATSVVDGRVRFLQFWFEMEHAYDDGLLELKWTDGAW